MTRVTDLLEEALRLLRGSAPSASAAPVARLGCSCRVHPRVRDSSGLPLVIELCLACTRSERGL
jgi:hypothetical protein